MDLVAEWDGDGIRQIFDDPGQPPASVRARLLAPDRGVRVRRVSSWTGSRPFRNPNGACSPAEGVRSVASVPIFMGEEWWGYLGFDDCTEDRVWDDGEVDALRSVAVVAG